MRPIRSMSRNGSIDKSQDTSAESRLLSSFSKITSKNNQRQQSTNISQISIDVYPSQSRHSLTIKQRQQSYNTSYQSSLYTSQQNSPKINRISMTLQQSLQQKQNTIQHLKIQLQQSRYIISTLKQQLKSVNLLLTQHKKQISLIKCQKCALYEQKMKQLQFLKNKQSQDDEFMETYEELISKLTQKIELLQNQNNSLKEKHNQKDSQYKHFYDIPTNNNPKTLNQPLHQQKPLLENKNFINQLKIIQQSQNFNKSSLQLGLQSNQKKSFSKQNHACTPKNNLPLSLSKNKFFTTSNIKQSFTNQKQHNKSKIQTEQKQHKQRVGYSPQKIKQKLIGKIDRKSINLINENLTQFDGLGGLKTMSRLDKKIYI